MNDQDARQIKRRSIRLKDHDYRNPGAYFVTICSYKSECLFGSVKHDRVLLSKLGQIVERNWHCTGRKRENVDLDVHMVMPNHFHGVIIIREWEGQSKVVSMKRSGRTGEQFGAPTADSIPSIIRAFKSSVTKAINEYRSTPGRQVWQRGFYDHVVRNEEELNRIRDYILTNPARWPFVHCRL